MDELRGKEILPMIANVLGPEMAAHTDVRKPKVQLETA